MKSDREWAQYICKRKRTFETKAEASKVRNRMVRQGVSRRETLVTYLCDVCGKYHNGNLPRDVREGIWT